MIQKGERYILVNSKIKYYLLKLNPFLYFALCITSKASYFCKVLMSWDHCDSLKDS